MPSTQRRGIGENLAEVLINMELELPIKEISLFQSDLKPSGAMYTRLFSASLGLLKE
jgi:2'-5' RNA ligase